MSSSAPQISYRRIGTILVEWRLITERQLAQALAEQEETGRLLGEILVSGYGVSRVDLADALAEQWQEANQASIAALDHSASRRVELEDGDEAGQAAEPLAEADLRVLLDEAEAARAELAVRTEELSRRLAKLETLVAGVNEALEDLRSATTQEGEERHDTPPRAPSRRTRSRAGARSSGSQRPAA